MYYTVYEITNTINSKIYIGVHVTNNMSDSYMGSGTALKEDIESIGKEFFKKRILFCYDNKEDMLKKEKDIVNKEFILREDTYNIALGGGEIYHHGHIITKDKDNNYILCNSKDTRFISGELVGVQKGKITVKDKDGKTLSVKVTDPRILSGELVHHTKGKVTVVNADGNTEHISINDPRYIDGKLTHINLNRKHIYKDGIRKNINESDLDYYIKEGWELKGYSKTSGKKWIHILDKKIRKCIKEEELDDYIKEGWTKGQGRW